MRDNLIKAISILALAALGFSLVSFSDKETETLAQNSFEISQNEANSDFSV